MRTNADLTLYNKIIVAGAETYQRTSIYDVAWENRKAANTIASGGQISVDSARVFIPYARGANYLQPKAFQALTSKVGKWTLAVGDVIVRGLVADEISSLFTLSALKAKYDDVLVISSVDPMLSGSQSMWHWQVGAK